MAAQKHTVTIRMGAAHWDVTVKGAGQFNLRTMDRSERAKFHGAFMGAVRKIIRGGAR